MDCLQVRESISARLDGEVSHLSGTFVEDHVHECQPCRAWRDAAHDVTRRARMTGWSTPDELPDFAASVTADASRRWSWLPKARAVLLAAAAIGQLVLAILLLTAVADPMGMHGDHELGVFDVTLGVAFAVGALRPKLAAGLAWPAGAAAAGLLVTATVDVIAHRTFELHELQHLIAVAGALLLFWAARDSRRGPQGVRRDLTAPASPELTGVTQLRSTAA
jgi:predicted anti-sigma-YlaC factor YlaD